MTSDMLVRMRRPKSKLSKFGTNWRLRICTQKKKNITIHKWDGHPTCETDVLNVNTIRALSPTSLRYSIQQEKTKDEVVPILK